MSAAARGRLRRCLRAPAAHFIVVGAVLFALQGGVLATRTARRPAPDRAPVVITQTEVARLEREFTRQTGFMPTPEDKTVLLDRAIEDEILYREALFRGLDRGDRSVRQRLINKMRFLSDEPKRGNDDLYREAKKLGLDRDDVVIRRMLTQKMRLLLSLPAAGGEKPTDGELREYFERHRDEYVQPARVTLWHVFLSREHHGVALESAARNLRRRLVFEAPSPEDAFRFGDPFPLGHAFEAKSRHELEKIFGSEFAGAVMDLSPGVWSRPIASAYGFHLVWVRGFDAPRVPALQAVRSRVALRFGAEREKTRFAKMMRQLRGLYEVRVERPPSAAEE